MSRTLANASPEAGAAPAGLGRGEIRRFGQLRRRRQHLFEQPPELGQACFDLGAEPRRSRPKSAPGAVFALRHRESTVLFSSTLRRMASWNTAIERARAPISSPRSLYGTRCTASPAATASVTRVTAASGRATDRRITSAPIIASNKAAAPNAVISIALVSVWPRRSGCRFPAIVSHKACRACRDRH